MGSLVYWIAGIALLAARSWLVRYRYRLATYQLYRMACHDRAVAAYRKFEQVCRQTAEERECSPREAAGQLWQILEEEQADIYKVDYDSFTMTVETPVELTFFDDLYFEPRGIKIDQISGRTIWIQNGVWKAVIWASTPSILHWIVEPRNWIECFHFPTRTWTDGSYPTIH